MSSKKSDDKGTDSEAVTQQVKKMLASTKEMEASLSTKMAQLEAVSREKSEFAKKEAIKIRADLEEIKRLSLINTKEGNDALKAKITEVNKEIEITTRKSAEYQKQIAKLQKETVDSLESRAGDLRKHIGKLPVVPEAEKEKMIAAVDRVVEQARAQWKKTQEIEANNKAQEARMKKLMLSSKMTKEKTLQQLDELLKTMSVYPAK